MVLWEKFQKQNMYSYQNLRVNKKQESMQTVEKTNEDSKIACLM